MRISHKMTLFDGRKRVGRFNVFHRDFFPGFLGSPFRDHLHGIGDAMPPAAADDEIAPIQRFTVQGGGDKSPGDILHIDVIPHLISCSVHGQGLAGKRTADHLVENATI